MGKQQRLLCASNNGSALMRAHLELMRSTTEIFWHKLIGYAHRHKVVERVIIDTFN